jgi:two-component system chemotaxis response regulator CheB
MRDERPLRFRCHTGHAFTSLSLEEGNEKRTEDAIWSAIRAVHERIILAQQRRRWAEHAGSTDDIAIEQTRIEENEKLVELLRAAIGATS